MPFALLEAWACNALVEAVAAAGGDVAVAAVFCAVGVGPVFICCAVGVGPVFIICLLVGDKLRVGRRVRDLEVG